MAKSINDLYREKNSARPSDSRPNDNPPIPTYHNVNHIHIPRSREYKGYWAGFWLGFFLQIIPGILIAWAIQSSIDKERYIGRHVVGSIHGWLTLIGLGVFIYALFFVVIMRG